MPAERVLVVLAHTDDEALGCGATLRRHVDAGSEVFCISLTNGVGARPDSHAAEAEQARRSAAEQSAQLLGFTWIASGNFPDNALDSVPLLDVARFVETAKTEVRPDILYTHHGGDLNVDHRVAFAAALTAFRPQPNESCREIRSFEVPSSTEWSHPSLGADFRPNLFIDVSDTWEAKRAALKAYHAEMRPFPHARSYQALDALSTWRGAQVGIPRAEAFEIVRRVLRGRDS